MMFPYTITNNSITVIVDGKSHTVSDSAPNFLALRGGILSGNEEIIRSNLSASKSVESWSNGKFRVSGDSVIYEDRTLPPELGKRILEMASKGEDPFIFFRFWERLKSNPSHRSVEQLYPFLNNHNIPFTKDGTFLAYKSIRSDWLDHHSGTIKNEVGKTIVMPRHKISDDPQHACHQGLHVGALEYATNFGSSDRKIIICEVDPKDVVCVPYDCSQQKMRVCEYKIFGVYGSPLSATVHEEDRIFVDELDDDEEEYEQEDFDGDTPPDHVCDSCTDQELDKASVTDLWSLSVDRLRKYARYLKIIGASKIVGGKTALIETISKARK